jgi:hypothetical protein
VRREKCGKAAVGAPARTRYEGPLSQPASRRHHGRSVRRSTRPPPMREQLAALVLYSAKKRLPCERAAVFHALACDPRIQRSALGHVPAAAWKRFHPAPPRGSGVRPSKPQSGHMSRLSARKTNSCSGGSARVISLADRGGGASGRSVASVPLCCHAHARPAAKLLGGGGRPQARPQELSINSSIAHAEPRLSFSGRGLQPLPRGRRKSAFRGSFSSRGAVFGGLTQ